MVGVRLNPQFPQTNSCGFCAHFVFKSFVTCNYLLPRRKPGPDIRDKRVQERGWLKHVVLCNHGREAGKLVDRQYVARPQRLVAKDICRAPQTFSVRVRRGWTLSTSLPRAFVKTSNVDPFRPFQGIQQGTSPLPADTGWQDPWMLTYPPISFIFAPFAYSLIERYGVGGR
jgi:hypothetical protein